MKQVLGVVVLVLLCGIVHGQNQTESSSNKGASPSGRIVNGQTVHVLSYPFVVVLQTNGVFSCGASIISNKNAVTAAHCLATGVSTSSVTLRAASNNPSAGGQIFQAESFIIHPGYDPRNYDNDVAIITITGSFATNQWITPIRLQETEIAPGNFPTLCYTLGWGRNNGTSGTFPNSLQFAVLQLLPDTTCKASYTKFTPQMMCAKASNVSVCSGDSGGPLVCNNRLAGITSLSEARCPTSGMNIFAKVASSSILSFIKKYMII